jgi:hypothetical protein
MPRRRPKVILWLVSRFLGLSLLAGVTPAGGSTEGRACSQRTTATIAFVGDLIFQGDLQREALARGSYRRFWSAAEPLFDAVDAVYGNLEGTLVNNVTFRGDIVADPGRDAASDVYASPPNVLNFNYHHSLASDLKASGFRIISTGNNHALDRGSSGVDQTIERLEGQHLAAVGTQHSNRAGSAWGVVTEAGAHRVGWVACTYSTNGYTDRLDQVLDCYGEQDDVLEAIRSLAERPDVDAVFFVPHWGIENQSVIARRQTALALDAIEAGATAVIGSHPHILQAWDWMTSSKGRTAPVVYSTGNFVSAQPLPHQRDGMIVLITLEKADATGKSELASARYVLTEFTRTASGIKFVGYDPERHGVLPREAHAALSEDNRLKKHSCR